MDTKKDRKSYDRYIVPAIEKAARVLLCLAETKATHMSLTEICAESGIQTSRAFYILSTLQRYGLAQRNIGGRGYSLGPGFIALSRKVLYNITLPQLSEPLLKELAKHAECTAMLGLIANEHVITVAKSEGGPDVLVNVQIGSSFPHTHGAEGKAIAAFMPEDELAELLQKNELYFHGRPENLDRERLQREFEECRHVGYALDLGEFVGRLNAVAAPVLGHNGEPIGCIIVVGLLSADKARQLGPEVVRAGRTISDLLADL